MIKLGMLIGDRYEVLEKIGTGGMSDVYKAKDQKLNRFVAVKILKQEFSENKNFVSKFRVEAQAAAGLLCLRSGGGRVLPAEKYAGGVPYGGFSGHASLAELQLSDPEGAQ